MTKARIKYEEESVLIAKYYHPKSDDYLDYRTKIVIKDSEETPIQMNLTFDGIFPFAAPMPPKEHTIRATMVACFREPFSDFRNLQLPAPCQPSYLKKTRII